MARLGLQRIAAMPESRLRAVDRALGKLKPDDTRLVPMKALRGQSRDAMEGKRLRRSESIPGRTGERTGSAFRRAPMLREAPRTVTTMLSSRQSTDE
jgi:hypothetical protein